MTPTPDVEAAVARRIAWRALYIGPVAVLAGWLLRGPDGGLAAGIGVTVVVANFLASGVILSAAARISMTFYHAAALFGFLLRLATISLTMLAVARLFEIDRRAFGVAAVACYLVLLTLEAAAIARRGASRDEERELERELEWTS